MADIERGLQWWVRYALVPILGSGGLAAAVAAYLNRTEPAARPQPPVAAAPAPTAPAPAEPVRRVELVSNAPAAPVTAPVEAAPADGCGLAGGRPAWRARYFHSVESGTWHVFVKSLGPNATRAEAEQAVEGFRDRFPEFGFLPMSTTEMSHGNAAWAVVVARGLESQGEAARVARLARDCGLARDAYFKREP